MPFARRRSTSKRRGHWTTDSHGGRVRRLGLQPPAAHRRRRASKSADADRRLRRAACVRLRPGEGLRGVGLQPPGAARCAPGPGSERVQRAAVRPAGAWRRPRGVGPRGGRGFVLSAAFAGVNGP